MKTVSMLVLAAVAVFPAATFAQDKTMAEGTGGQIALPKACEDAAGSMDTSNMTGDTEAMSGHSMGEAEKANMGAMMQMQRAMMRAAKIKDADLAFNCGMIAHHQGAIAMSEVELKMGKDEQSKKLAQTIIDAQKKEIAEMTAWVERHAR